MSFFIAILKCIFCVEDWEERQIRHQLQRSFVSFPEQSCYVLDGDCNDDKVSRTSAHVTSQANFGQKANSSGAHNGSYPSQTKSTYITNGETVDKKLVPVKLSRDDDVKSRSGDAVSVTNASQQPSIPKRKNVDSNLASIKLSGNQIVKSIDSSPVTGNNKDSSVSSQFALASLCSLKPSSVASEPSLSSISVKPSEIFQKVKCLSSSSSIHPSTAKANYGETTNSSSAQNELYPSQAKATDFTNRETIEKNSAPIQLSRADAVNSRAKDVVSGINVSKQPSIPKRENIDRNLASIRLSGNQIVSEKPGEIPQKLKILGSSFSIANIDHGEDTSKETNNSNDKRHYDNISSAASKPLQSSMRFTFSSNCINSSPSTFESGNSPQKTNKPLSSSLLEKSHSKKPPPISIKPTISLVSSSSLSPQKKTSYVWVKRDASSTYVFPKEIKSLIEKDIVPGVLKMPLSKSSYKDYFHALLYAEDCYLEKWDGFEMKNVKVELHAAAIYKRRGKIRNLNKDDDKEEKDFVAFELDKIRERRPFLISRDFVSLKPSNPKIKTFQGVIYRVVKSNVVLAEFAEEFYSQHHPEEKYDVKFSFNRVCLKRAHRAIATTSDSLFRTLLFPNVEPKHELPSMELFAKNKYQLEAFAVRQILRLKGPPPYLVEGPLVVEKDHLSTTGVVIVEAILRIFRADPSKKILLCAPVNKTCDLLMRGLKKEMAESDMFRANAAFRELDGVPIDVLPSCLYKKEMECFCCPSLEELKKYKVILTTFMSSFRLYSEGLIAGHFSHIFLVDASFATEPETLVPLANFANDTTIVVVTGTPRNHSGWIRSKIARENGLMTSYFERLCDSDMYRKLDPKFIVQLEDNEKDKNDISSYLF